MGCILGKEDLLMADLPGNRTGRFKVRDSTHSYWATGESFSPVNPSDLALRANLFETDK